MYIQNTSTYSEFGSKTDKEVILYRPAFANETLTDFTKFDMMQALCNAKQLNQENFTYSPIYLIDTNIVNRYKSLINDCVNLPPIPLPSIQYKGKLADEYALLTKKKNELSDNPEFNNFGRQLFEHAHFDGDFPEADDKLQSLRDEIFELEQQCWKISNKIQNELGLGINTISLPRTPNGSNWNYNLPTTLTLEVFKQNETLVAEIEKMVNDTIDSFSLELVEVYENEKDWKMTIKLK